MKKVIDVLFVILITTLILLLYFSYIYGVPILTNSSIRETKKSGYYNTVGLIDPTYALRIDITNVTHKIAYPTYNYILCIKNTASIPVVIENITMKPLNPFPLNKKYIIKIERIKPELPINIASNETIYVNVTISNKYLAYIEEMYNKGKFYLSLNPLISSFGGVYVDRYGIVLEDTRWAKNLTLIIKYKILNNIYIITKSLLESTKEYFFHKYFRNHYIYVVTDLYRYNFHIIAINNSARLFVVNDIWLHNYGNDRVVIKKLIINLYFNCTDSSTDKYGYNYMKAYVLRYVKYVNIVLDPNQDYFYNISLLVNYGKY